MVSICIFVIASNSHYFDINKRYYCHTTKSGSYKKDCKTSDPYIFLICHPEQFSFPPGTFLPMVKDSYSLCDGTQSSIFIQYFFWLGRMFLNNSHPTSHWLSIKQALTKRMWRPLVSRSSWKELGSCHSTLAASGNLNTLKI